MVTYAVYLRPKGPFSGPVSSDQLFGALCTCMGVLGVDLGSLFQQGPAFGVSSAFPLKLGASRLRFYPRPLTFNVFNDVIQTVTQKSASVSGYPAKSVLKTTIAEVKALRDTAYLSEGLFFQVAAGAVRPEDVVRDAVDGSLKVKKERLYIRCGGLLMLAGEAAGWPKGSGGDLLPLSAEAETMHNQVDRVAGATGEGLLFYEPQTRFAAHGGLWVLLRAENPAILNTQIFPALRLLGDTGLGANRTSGYGCFELIATEPLVVNPAEKGQPNAWMALSRYLPNKDEWRDGEPLAYRLVSLWPKREQNYAPNATPGTTAPIYKRRLRVFEAGSVFPLSPAENPAPWMGRLAELVKADEGPHPVYQSGRAIVIPLVVT